MICFPGQTICFEMKPCVAHKHCLLSRRKWKLKHDCLSPRLFCRAPPLNKLAKHQTLECSCPTERVSASTLATQHPARRRIPLLTSLPSIPSLRLQAANPFIYPSTFAERTGCRRTSRVRQATLSNFLHRRRNATPRLRTRPTATIRSA